MLALLSTQTLAAQFRPVVLLHGLLAESEAMQHAENWIKQDFPGIYVLNAKARNLPCGPISPGWSITISPAVMRWRGMSC